MSGNQFWWVRVRHEDGTEGILQLAEVEFEGGAPRQANFINTCATLTMADMDKLTLIERVLPAGRVTAAAIREVLVGSDRNGAGYVGRLQSCEETDDEGESTGRAFTLIDGCFDMEKAAEILRCEVVTWERR